VISFYEWKVTCANSRYQSALNTEQMNKVKKLFQSIIPEHGFFTANPKKTNAINIMSLGNVDGARQFIEFLKTYLIEEKDKLRITDSIESIKKSRVLIEKILNVLEKRNDKEFIELIGADLRLALDINRVVNSNLSELFFKPLFDIDYCYRELPFTTFIFLKIFFKVLI
jgi:hypothetical protein